jgi:hypothetical protein
MTRNYLVPRKSDGGAKLSQSLCVTQAPDQAALLTLRDGGWV